MEFPSISCDWLTLSHRFAEPVKPLDAGRTLKIDRDGVIEYEKLDWERLYCPSSDTSLRVYCDGERLRCAGNISRWQRQNNLFGLTVVDCISEWARVLSLLGIPMHMFGTVQGLGTVGECGTFISRVDLAGNFETDNYSALCSSLMNQRLGRRAPLMGKYGPTWGYQSKRSNWVKAKVYDKTCELEGRRTPAVGATVGRFEVQLGSEFLKREGLNIVSGWKGGGDMEKVIHGRFAEQIFRDSAPVQSWDDLPVRLRGYAYAWRDGINLRRELSKSSFYRFRNQLMEFGIDIAVECNVIALTTRVREVKVTPIHALREAA